MTTIALSREQSREVDRRAIEEYGFSGLVLMENAGRGVADAIQSLGACGPVLVCCGIGNNGGDGFVIARHLDLRGVAVHVAVWGDVARMTADAAANFRILEKSGVAIERFGCRHESGRLAGLLAGAGCVVDALLGTGARGEPRPPLDAVIERLNAHPAPRVAVDIPSGLDCDTGEPARCTIRASLTCTFVAPKRGFLNPAAAPYTGEIRILDIGAPRKLIGEILAG